jgi:hypothetical protein
MSKRLTLELAVTVRKSPIRELQATRRELLVQLAHKTSEPARKKAGEQTMICLAEKHAFRANAGTNVSTQPETPVRPTRIVAAVPQFALTRLHGPIFVYFVSVAKLPVAVKTFRLHSIVEQLFSNSALSNPTRHGDSWSQPTQFVAENKNYN